MVEKAVIMPGNIIKNAISEKEFMIICKELGLME